MVLEKLCSVNTPSNIVMDGFHYGVSTTKLLFPILSKSEQEHPRASGHVPDPKDILKVFVSSWFLRFQDRVSKDGVWFKISTLAPFGCFFVDREKEKKSDISPYPLS